MATITTINATDLITDSRTDINTNFENLNSDKIETSVIDTDTTLVANSDAKIPSQKAVKAYVDAGGNVNASTTAKGIVEEATAAEIAAGTAAGATGARLFINPSTAPRVTVAVPRPLGVYSAIGTISISNTTTAHVAMYSLPEAITVNKISFRTSTVSTGDTIDLSLYSEDGQTQYFSVTSASVATTTTYTVSVGSVALSPGNYYLLINANSGTPNLQIFAYDANVAPFATTTTGSLSDISSEPVALGSLSITAGTPPATITPGSITPATTSASTGKPIIFRLDN